MNTLPSMIIEGFICPECQQDLSSIELLQTHFELFHSKKQAKSNGSSLNSNGLGDETSKSSLSNVFAKAKTLISSSFDQQSSINDLNNNNGYSDVASSTQTLSIIPQSSSYANNSNQSNSAASNSAFQNNASQIVNNYKSYLNANQAEGSVRSLTNEYKKHRDNTIGRYVVQQNKLLIILDRLISVDLDVYSNENEREMHYKSIVSWVNDKDVHLCPNCAKSFNLLNRKHHCRLCGAIMCNKCSQFISFSQAKQLTDPDTLIKSLNSADDPNASSQEFKLRRSDSITSLNSYFFNKNTANTSNNEPSTALSKLTFTKNIKSNNLELIYLRLCHDCGVALEKKYKSLKDKTLRPQFANLYDQLYSCISEAKRLYPTFTKMAESLSCGEAVYQLGKAEDMRHHLIKLFQQTESFSGYILKYGCNGDEQTVSNDQLKLQRNIRLYAINFLKDHSFNLRPLPTKDEYEKLKSQRQIYLMEEMRRVELEQMKQKQAINEQMAKRKPNSHKNEHRHKIDAKISIDNSNGWMPTVKAATLLDDDNDDHDEYEDDQQNSDDLNEDGTRSICSKKSSNMSEQEKALRIQIQLVEGYLQDAIKHNKREEADLLQQNLNELLNVLVEK